MKRCPTCNRSYQDENVRFCLEDGAALIDGDGPEKNRAVSTQEIGHSSKVAPTIQTPVVPTIQAPYVTAAWPTPAASDPASNERRRRSWILAVIAVLSLAVTAALIAALIHRNVSSVANSVPSQNDTRANDETRRLTELTTLESELNRAIIEGDKAALERILADDFVNSDEKGKTSDKKQFIASIRAGAYKSIDILEPKLMSSSSDKAVMTLVRKYQSKRNTTNSRETETYVNRGGRWQIVSSQTTDLKSK
jgi:hypothetical protein